MQLKPLSLEGASLLEVLAHTGSLCQTGGAEGHCGEVVVVPEVNSLNNNLSCILS